MRRLAGAAAGIVALLIAGWWILGGGRQPAPVAVLGPSEITAAPPTRDDHPRPPGPAARGPAAAAPPPVVATAPDAGAPRSGTPDAGEELPPTHPITPAHVRIQRENNLIGSMNGAMDVNDGAGLRNLLDQYRREYPDDPNQLQEGYGVIADCLQRPGDASTAAGQRYFDRERGSILRRFVARHCQLQLP